MRIRNIQLFLIFLLFHSCDSPQDNISHEKVIQDSLYWMTYEREMEAYFDSLIVDRINKKTKIELINDIKGHHISSAYVGIEGSLSDQYLSYEALLKISSKEDLFEMVNTTNPSLRYYGFLGIFNQEREYTLKTLKQLIGDTTKITTHFGCVFDKMTLADLCVNFLLETESLSKEEKSKLDKMVLASPVNLQYKKQLKSKQ